MSDRAPTPVLPLASPSSAAFAAPAGGVWRDVAASDWQDWRWQLRNRLRTADELAQHFVIPPELRAFLEAGHGFEVAITPFFASLCRPFDPTCPLARQVLPDVAEATVRSFERADPLGEDPYRKAPGIVHKYPDRVLFLVTDTCAAYCRYCTRARWVASGADSLGSAEQEAALAYIEQTPTIRDVLISGGDPLLLSSPKLNALLDRLAQIPHLRFLRIGTRVPVFLPMRIDAELVHALRPRRIPVYLNVHCNHFAELAEPVRDALARLADGGVSLGGQTVLLRGVNDTAPVLQETFYALLSARVRPYYLFHCDPIRGSAHLRTSVDEGLDLMRQLIGHTSGMAVPKYVIDLEGGGKIPLWPDFVEQMDRNVLHVTNFRGERWQYVNHAD